MRDYGHEADKRVEWIRGILSNSGAKGIIYGNSGGKDSVLVGILCKMAADNVLGVIMPCGSAQNYGSDREDALLVAEKYGIETATVDLTDVKIQLSEELNKTTSISRQAAININPRLRMTTLYALGQSMGYLVAGTGNRSEIYMGYFTKWGDGAFDFNPIGDLTATEVFEFLRYLDAPSAIIDKAPSAGLYEGQTDEQDMGVSYAAIDRFIESSDGSLEDIEVITRAHRQTGHKREGTLIYGLSR